MKLTPFKRWTIENFPFIEEDFDAITNYQLYCKIVEYLNKVIASQNATIEQVEAMQEYLDSLDIQELVDNKLDEMAESGQLTDIIAQYLDLAGVLAYDTISAMANAENLTNGSTCYCLGRNSYNDGQGAFYKIRQVTTEDVIDGYLIVAIVNDNTIIGERLLPAVTPKKYLFIGDSYTEGYTPDGSVTTFPELFRQRMGLSSSQVEVAYHGGYGFARSGNKFETIIQALDPDDDITDVFILGGYNDRNYNYTDVYNGIETCKGLINTKFKNATLYIGQVGCSNNSANTYSLYIVSSNYINACNTLNIKYISNIEYVLHNYFNNFSSDGFHPNQNGHSALAYALQKYVVNGYLNTRINLMDIGATGYGDFSLPSNIGGKITVEMINNTTYIANKLNFSITSSGTNMSGNGTRYQVGTITAGCLIGSDYATNNINVDLLVKTNGTFKKVAGIIGFDHGGIFISLLDINNAGSNYGSYNNVTEIIVPPFSASFTSNLS